MIDPRAIIDPSATIGDNVEIGPWTIVGPNVDIGDNCVVASHVVLKGPTRMGKGNKIYQFSTVGDDTPDLKYQGEETTLVIGDNNVIREGVTIHRGTVQDRGETTIGNNNLFMAYSHVGHDSVIGNHCILVNNSALAGHVVLGDWTILSGYALVHQYCKLGAHSFMGMGAAVGKDIPAFVTVTGNPGEPKGVNVEGLKRRGFSTEAIADIRRAYKLLYRQGLTVDDALSRMTELVERSPEVAVFVESVRQSARGIVR
ncbi:MAG: acyl-[acyl-carrier-protein]--UDP-N-acetylglucosamine O-acyltransferase [Spongiibacteraceae bacterium]|nr:acyl-[acyl-carrier-protein]--UDP-N-acetylglucosamine O-acyltransferase [Spongiibacteraceae bacterium]MBN48429.1 acyl-[acyl-carrier-protein]--UDP-N-acetylglucosamine O-acyltransferase [Spongiibacteraceae bacterium]|tara:strand:- start:258 stop:1028 length:771 start_codon:yes stop_codon:yes gene_type:complete